jgi:hypothetical protein
MRLRTQVAVAVWSAAASVPALYAARELGAPDLAAAGAAVAAFFLAAYALIYAFTPHATTAND